MASPGAAFVRKANRAGMLLNGDRLSSERQAPVADNSEITAPVAKAATALTAGASTSVVSMSQAAQSFLPTDLGGWMALTASTLAVLYSIHLLGEWYWKKFWRPLFERRGWLAPKAKAKMLLVDPEQLQQVTE